VDSDASVVKVIELVGSSERSFSDAVRNAVRIASRSIRNITGVEVLGSTADVDSAGDLVRYKVNCKIAFVVDAARIEGASVDEDAPSGLELTGGGARTSEDMALGGHMPET
jgi:flavin-binding protein dodecin